MAKPQCDFWIIGPKNFQTSHIVHHTVWENIVGFLWALVETVPMIKNIKQS